MSKNVTRISVKNRNNNNFRTLQTKVASVNGSIIVSSILHAALILVTALRL